MPWQEGQPVPYDGWYNGNVDMMLANGTYADFRPKIERRCQKGFYSEKGTLEEKQAESMKKLEAWDKRWNAIPEAKRLELRNNVADDVEPKEHIVYTARGPMKTLKSRPSRNNNLDRTRNQKPKVRRRLLMPGAIQRQDAAAAVRLPGAAQAPAAPAAPGAQAPQSPAAPQVVGQ